MSKFLLCFSLFFGLCASAQTQEIDSLKRRLVKEKETDTLRITDLNELAWQFLDYSVDSAQKYVRMALQLSEKLDYLNGTIEGKNVQGILYRYAGESEKAIALYEEIIRLRTQQGRLDKLTGAYSNLGSVYFEKNDNANALRYYHKAFKNATEFKQTDNQMVLLNNIGATYQSSGLSELAIETYKKGIDLNRGRNDEFQEAMFSLNLGNVYDHQGFYKEGSKYYQYAYKIFKKRQNIRQLSVVIYNYNLNMRELKDFKGTADLLKEMEEIADQLKEERYYATFHQAKAGHYMDLKKYPEALLEIDRSLALTDSASELPDYSSRLLIKSSIYAKLPNYTRALEYNERGLAIKKLLDDKIHVVTAYQTRSEIHEGMGDLKSALMYYRRAVAINDSLSNENFNTKMATLNSLNELDKKEKELQLSISEKESIEAKHKQQSAFLTASIIIAALVLCLLVFSVRAYRIKKRDNQLLNSQKQEIELKNRALQERQAEIEKQKMLVEEKQKEILDSIRYAKRIQSTLMANKELIDHNLAENFILFKPKDIVSGDFYWATEKDNYFYLAVCDSTGHGVPGAFMSLLNISFLNEAINEKNIIEPHEVLNHVRLKLINSISQDGAKDGMDCILLRFDKQSNTITYAAAQNSLLLVHNNEIKELPSDKMPVGKGENLNSFTLHTIQPEKGDILYLYSDGFADQFGGPKGKKFKYRQLQEQLLKHTRLQLSEQAKAMEAIFENWKGNLEQVDDVVLVGIRV